MEVKTLLGDNIDLFDSCIIFKAEEIMLQIKSSNKQYRGNKRKLAIFYCIFQAFKENNYIILPEDLASILNIEKKDINKAFKLFTKNNNYVRPSIYYSISDFITYFLTKHTILQQYIKSDIYNNIPKVQGKPQKIALIIIVYYLKDIGFSNNTILKLLKDEVVKIPTKPKWLL